LREPSDHDAQARVLAGEHRVRRDVQGAHEEERDAEHERVLAERLGYGQRRDQQRPHRRQEDDADRALVGSRRVGEPGVPAPGEREHHQNRERFDERCPAGIVVDEARDLRDREHEHEVEEELECGDALLALDHGLVGTLVQGPDHRCDEGSSHAA
jgi:hypothetical protein